MNKTCAKCEGRHIGVKYDKVFDRLDYKCETCEYQWTAPPADHNRSGEGKFYVTNPAPDAAAPSVPSGICGTGMVTR